MIVAHRIIRDHHALRYARTPQDQGIWGHPLTSRDSRGASRTAIDRPLIAAKQIAVILRVKNGCGRFLRQRVVLGQR
jgi:hypothetical protein